MTQSTIIYSGNTTITMDLSSLGTSSTWVAGRESSEIDNTSNKYVDAIVQGTVTVGTTPTANTQINVYVWGASTSLGTTAIDTLDGTDSAETISQVGILRAIPIGAVVTITSTTSNVVMPVLPFSVAALFGGNMPKFWGLFVSHNTGVNLNASNSNTFSFNGIKYDMS